MYFVVLEFSTTKDLRLASPMIFVGEDTNVASKNNHIVVLVKTQNKLILSCLLTTTKVLNVSHHLPK